MQWTRQHTFVIQSTLYCFAHHLPYLTQIIPYLFAFAVLHILPVIPTHLIAVILNIAQSPQRINIWTHISRLLILFLQRTATYGIHCPILQQLSFAIPSAKAHAIGVKWQKLIMPHDLPCGYHIYNSSIGQVSFACC